MSGFEKPWLLLNTQGEWRHVFYTMSSLERFGDIVFFDVKGLPETVVDFDQVLRKTDKQPAVFAVGDAPLNLVAYAGAAVRLDFSAVNKSIAYLSLDKPEGSALDPKTGAFSWNPTTPGDCVFVVEATVGDIVTPKKVAIRTVSALVGLYA